MSTIISSLITGLCAIVVCLISSLISSKLQRKQNLENYQLIEYRIKELEVHVKQHNNLDTRITRLEALNEKLNKSI